MIDESKVNLSSPDSMLKSVYANYDPNNLSSDDYSNIRKLLKKFWNMDKASWKIKDSHIAYWKLFRLRKEIL